MDINPIFLLLSGAALSAAAAYGLARSKYEGLLNDELRERGPALERARKEERARAADAQREKEDEARRSIEAARKEATMEAREAALSAVESAKEESRRQIDDLKASAAQREERAAEREKRASEKQELATTKEQALAKLEAAIRTRETGIIETQAEAAKLVNERRATLEGLAGLSGEEAKKRLMGEILDAIRPDVAREAKAIEDAARDEAEKRAKRIIGIAIGRYAGEHVQERAVTSVHLPNDDMKGRIIGREGRNIRALQDSCGVDFIVDDTPETIVISGFDPVRREVARLAVERLIQDGRIHPTKIEEEVLRAREDVGKSLDEAAEAALTSLSVTHVHPELLKLLGKLHFRYSFSQNVLRHSMECGFLSGLMAAELGQDEGLARRAGLLHDIGKAVSHEKEGSHAVIGAQLARKYGEDPIVADSIACHHEDEPPSSVIAHLVAAADAISGARPGARREMLDGYVKRLRDLEAISSRFAGVERAFALQAGREVRVVVEPSEVSDAEAALLAREISRRIEEELSYPGQIRVTVVRETRAVDYAK